MILLYHKVHPDSKTMWWVDVESFYRQMLQLRSRRVVLLDDYDPSDPQQVVITFDGIYRNVLQYAAPFLFEFGYPFELFVTSDYIGGDNAFDTSEPLAEFTTREELSELVRLGGRLQWHTRSHPNMKNETSRKRLIRELEIPDDVLALDPKGWRWFAYPYGEFSDVAVEETRKRFDGALSCIQGDDQDRYRLNRLIMYSDTEIDLRKKVAVVIPSYNYGSFLPEAVESVLRQTQLPDQLHIVDDCSADDTELIGRDYAARFPGLIHFHRNSTNLGIVDNFNAAVMRADADYVIILGADNRIPSHYVDTLAAALDKQPDVGVAYSDFVLFGPRAKLVWQEFPDTWRGRSIRETLYPVHFPEFASLEQLRERNFIHGSAMYRRDAFLIVGGYKSTTGVPEDFGLFTRIIERGWKAVRCHGPMLEYRQHSRDQAQNRLVREEALNWYQRRFRELTSSEETWQQKWDALQVAFQGAEKLATERLQMYIATDTILRETNEALARVEHLAIERLAALAHLQVRLDGRRVYMIHREEQLRATERELRASSELAAERLKALQVEQQYRQVAEVVASHRLKLLIAERKLRARGKFRLATIRIAQLFRRLLRKLPLSRRITQRSVRILIGR